MCTAHVERHQDGPRALATSCICHYALQAIILLGGGGGGGDNLAVSPRQSNSQILFDYSYAV